MKRFLPLLVIVGVALTTVLLRNNIQAAVKGYELANSPAKGELSSSSYLERILLSDGELEQNASKGIWFNKPVLVPTKTLASLFDSVPANVLGENTEEKWIEIDLSTQTLYAHEGGRTVYTFPVSTGLPWMPTVTGEFRIWAKLVSTRMSGGSKADGTFYDLPNVPYTQYFYKGYGVHGAYWHNDFGHPRSHGCVNMRPEDAKVLFYWTNPLESL